MNRGVGVILLEFGVSTSGIVLLAEGGVLSCGAARPVSSTFSPDRLPALVRPSAVRALPILLSKALRCLTSRRLEGGSDHFCVWGKEVPKEVHTNLKKKELAKNTVFTTFELCCSRGSAASVCNADPRAYAQVLARLSAFSFLKP